MGEERQRHWDGVYRQKGNREVSWYQEYPDLSLQLIEQSAIARDEPIIDVGGGASVLVDNLLQKGFSQLAVLDISASALECAKRRLAGRAEQVDWLVSDVTRFVPQHPFVLWHDRAVFHFLTDEHDRQRYIEILKTSLVDNGYLVLATFAPDGPQMCSGLPVECYDTDKMRAVLGSEFTLLDSRREAHTTPSGMVQRFTYALFRYHSG